MDLEFSNHWKYFFKAEGEIKTFLDKQKLREFIDSMPLLPEMLKELLMTLHEEMKSR